MNLTKEIQILTMLFKTIKNSGLNLNIKCHSMNSKYKQIYYVRVSKDFTKKSITQNKINSVRKKKDIISHKDPSVYTFLTCYLLLVA